MSTYVIFGVGLLAQGFFAARLLVQWFLSEKTKKIESPVLFWQFSMLGSLTLCLYGWLRYDFAIVLGQFVLYYIYIWNLNIKGSWIKIPAPMRIVFFSIPIISAAYLAAGWSDTVERLFGQQDIPMWLIVYGVVGQFTFTLRFIYQWWYSRKRGESILPIFFWILSLTGSLLIVSYAVLRRDPILIIGQATGMVVYARNLMIGYQARKRGDI